MPETSTYEVHRVTKPWNICAQTGSRLVQIPSETSRLVWSLIKSTPCISAFIQHYIARIYTTYTTNMANVIMAKYTKYATILCKMLRKFTNITYRVITLPVYISKNWSTLNVQCVSSWVREVGWSFFFSLIDIRLIWHPLRTESD